MTERSREEMVRRWSDLELEVGMTAISRGKLGLEWSWSIQEEVIRRKEILFRRKARELGTIEEAAGWAS